MDIELMKAEDHNILPDVVTAHKRVEGSDKLQELMSRLAEAILTRGYEEVIAVRLVHRHHTLLPGQVMFEQEKVEDGQHLLITSAVDESEVRVQNSVPNVIAVTDGGLCAFEHADTSMIPELELYKQALADSEFLEEVGTAIKASGLSDVIGIGCATKSFFDLGKDDEVLIELNDPDEFANKVGWKPRKDFKSGIQTLWRFGRKGGKAKAGSMVVGQVSFTGGGPIFCEVYCQQECVWYTPGHAIDHGFYSC